MLTWDRPPHTVVVARLRRAVLARLGSLRSDTTTDESLSQADAQSLIARAEGFEHWDDLIRSADA